MHLTKTVVFYMFSVTWVSVLTYCRYRTSRAGPKTEEGARFARWTVRVVFAGIVFFILLPLLSQTPARERLTRPFQRALRWRARGELDFRTLGSSSVESDFCPIKWHDLCVDQPPDKFSLELAGPGVEPDTVDSAKLLAFASAYFDLIRRMGSDDDIPIAFHGLEILNKCVAVRVRPNDAEQAKRLAGVSAAYLQGGPPPAGLKILVERVRQSFSQFEGDYTAKVIVGDWEMPLIAPEPMMSLFPLATETMRVIVLRVGGASPRVRVRSMLDGDTFSIDLTSEQAKALASHLYQHVDIVVRAMRTGEGKVVFCELLEFTPLVARDSMQALDEWFRPHASFWDQVKDVSQALGRRDRS